MKLTDTQLVILSAASQREDGCVLPLPKSLRGNAAGKVIKALLKNKLVEEVEALKNDLAWRKTGDGHGVTLVITGWGYDAIGADPRPFLTRAKPEPKAKAPKKEKAPKAEPGAPREGTKQAALIDMLRRKTGATIEEIAAATGWQNHTIRGAMAGALKKKLGLQIASDKIEGRGRVYRIPA